MIATLRRLRTGSLNLPSVTPVLPFLTPSPVSFPGFFPPSCVLAVLIPFALLLTRLFLELLCCDTFRDPFFVLPVRRVRDSPFSGKKKYVSQAHYGPYISLKTTLIRISHLLFFAV